jgi:predicted permease
MRQLRAWFIRLGEFFRKPLRERDLSAEMETHLAMHTEDNLRAGMTPEEARRGALIQLGGLEQTKEIYRDRRGLPFLESFFQDVRHALRILRKSPGFTAVAILTLALGIGANSAIFSVVQGVLLAPLPYFQPNQLMYIREFNRTLKHPVWVSYPDFLDWRRSSRSFQQMAAQGGIDDFNLTSPGTPERLEGRTISSGFFSTLGANLALGREFSPEEDKHGGAPEIIITDRLWKERFRGSVDALGKSVALDGVDYTIVGVIPSRFWFGDHADVYLSVGQGNPLLLDDRTIPRVVCIARLKSGVTVAQAQSELDAVQENLDRLYPAADRGLATHVAPLKQEIVGDAGGMLLLLLGAVGIVLLIACANVANLLLARSAARTREFAIRSALGASRVRVVRQLLTESVLLSLAGGGLGLLAAKWSLSAVLAAGPESLLPRSANISVNHSVLFFAFGISLTVGILFGLAPALKSSRADLQTSLNAGGRGSTNSHYRAQSSLVIVQMALTLVLLAGAGLLFRTIRHLWEVNPGFDPRNVITFRVGLSPSLTKTPASKQIAYKQLVERIRQIPGVQAADLTVLVPLSQEVNSGPFLVGTQESASIPEAPRALFYWTGPDYLRVMGIRLLRGRYLTAEDTTNSPPVAVIDSALARTYFPGKDPIGQILTIPHWRPVQIVGVVGHVQHWDLGNLENPESSTVGANRFIQNQIYASLYQLSDEWIANFYDGVTVTVRTPLDTAAVLPAIKAAVYGTGGGQPVYDVRTMQQLVSESMSSQRFPMILLGTFAGLALLLASVGIYGVISYSVAQRVNEIGIRMALGAEKRNIFRMIVGHGLRLALAGLAIGAVVALILTRLMSSFSHLLYGVGTNDPLTFAVVSLVLTVVAVLACYLPARRGTKVDPMVALRYE